MSGFSSSCRRAVVLALVLAGSAAAQGIDYPPPSWSTDDATVCVAPFRVEAPSGAFALTQPSAGVCQLDLNNTVVRGNDQIVGNVLGEAVAYDCGAGTLTCGGDASTIGRFCTTDAGYLKYCDGSTTTVRTGVENDLAATLTNKTLDAEAAGNVLTLPTETWIPTAICQNAIASSNWNTTSATDPSPACTGSNVHDAILNFDGAADECVEMHLALPTTWVGAIDVAYRWLTSATTGSVTWCSQFVCVADGETNDPSYPAQSSSNCVSDAAKGTTLQMNDAVDTGVAATGCAAGEILHWRLCRDPDATAGLTDDITADAGLQQVMLRLRVAL